jgi:hypothetical protein
VLFRSVRIFCGTPKKPFDKAIREVLNTDPDNVYAKLYEMMFDNTLNSAILDAYFAAIEKAALTEQQKIFIAEVFLKFQNSILKKYILKLLNASSLEAEKNRLKAQLTELETKWNQSVFNAKLDRDVFVCFKNEDYETALQIITAIEKDAHRCWHYKRNLANYTGEKFWDEIETAINHCTVFLIILSENSMLSHDCDRELEYAQSLGKDFVGYRIDCYSPTTAINTLFGSGKGNIISSVWIETLIDDKFSDLNKAIYDRKQLAKAERIAKAEAERLAKLKPQPAGQDAFERKLFTFGRYQTKADGSDNEPIEWIKLEQNGNRALLLSSKILDCQRYHKDQAYSKGFTVKKNDFVGYYTANEAESRRFWKGSDLHDWLNGKFINTAFTPEQRLMLEDKGDGKVFLLSVEEATKAFEARTPAAWGYFNKGDDGYRYTPLAICKGTEYAKKPKPDEKSGSILALSWRQNMTAPPEFKWRNNHKPYDDDRLYSNFKDPSAFSSCDGSSWWWLRSPGSSVGCAAIVYLYGYVDADGYGVSDHYVGVRPALWINL